MGNRGLEGVEAVIHWQQRLPAKSASDRRFLDRQNGRSDVLGPNRDVGRRRAPLPLGHRLLIDPVALRQSPQARFTMAYYVDGPRHDPIDRPKPIDFGLDIKLWAQGFVSTAAATALERSSFDDLST